jgi:hypothetical protein
MQRIQSTLQQPIGDDRIPARHDDREPLACSRKVAFNGDRAIVQRVL